MEEDGIVRTKIIVRSCLGFTGDAEKKSDKMIKHMVRSEWKQVLNKFLSFSCERKQEEMVV